MGVKMWLVVGATLMVASWAAAATAPMSGRNSVTVRGQEQDVYFFPAQGAAQHRTVLYLPGVGGWEGWGITVAETMASWGYDVYGVDTKRYLDSFTTSNSTLNENDVAADLSMIAEWAGQQSSQPVTLVGWSEGAGLSVLAAAGDKPLFDGLVAIGLEDRNVISWHWADNLKALFKKPHEDEFSAAGYMPQIAPRPVVMIQSSRDQYVTMNEAQHLFDAAREPKRFEVVQASNHRFDGNHDEFFTTLRDGLTWIAQPQQQALGVTPRSHSL